MSDPNNEYQRALRVATAARFLMPYKDESLPEFAERVFRIGFKEGWIRAPREKKT